MFPIPATLMAPLVKICFYLIGTLVAAGIVVGAYNVWKKSIVAEANAALVVRQLEEALRQAELAAEQQKRIQAEVDRLSAQLRQQREEADRRLDEIEKGIDGAEDRPSSDVLKDTIRKLGGG